MKKEEVLKGVEILAQGCEECIKENKKVYTFEEALKEMLLPNKNCKHKMDNNKFSFCRCCYLPVIEN